MKSISGLVTYAMTKASSACENASLIRFQHNKVYPTRMSIRSLLAVYAAANGIRASVTLEVTFTTTPDLRVRNWRSAACVIAITLNVLVSTHGRCSLA